MAGMPVTISGLLFDKLNKTQQTVTIIGGLVRNDLTVGGGPIIGGGEPPGIWPNPPEGTAPHPEHPIVLPDPPPIQIPPGIWPNPPEGIAPHPEHPIVIPPPDGSPPGTPAFEVHVLWSQPTGWVVVMVPQFPHPAPSKR